ncbi:MAG: cell division protein SepF [Defluviitaleaceae bacterium]|nr:cell division protein SepF [Defluviitaleaceae bacterium]
MIGFFKNISDKLSNKMLAPGAQETDEYYGDYYEDDYEENHDEYYDEPEQLQVRYSRQEKTSRGKSAPSSVSRGSSRGAKDNVYGFTPNPVTVHKQSETVIQHPKNMEDAVEIGNHVRSGRMNIVDLTGVPTAEAQRIADYLCGISDALDGAITRVNNTIITVSPPTHRVMQDYRDDSSFDSGFLKKASNGR